MDSPQRPCLPSYPCLTALACDLQSMLHRTLPHLTVITNKHHAQSLRLLFCLLRCQFLTVRPKSGGGKEVPWPPFSHKGPTAWKGKGQAWGGTIFPGSPTPAPSCPGAPREITSSTERTCWEVGKRLSHSLTLSLPQAKRP